MSSKRNKYDIGLPRQDVGEEECNRVECYSLEPWNKLVEEAYRSLEERGEVREAFLPPNMWNEWLWGFDPTEACHIECLLNRSQLLGLLLARYRAIYQVRYSTSSNTLVDFLGDEGVGMLSLLDIAVKAYNLRELRDTIQNIQLKWVDCHCISIPTMKNVVNALFHRFGVLALRSWGPTEMNDQVSTVYTNQLFHLFITNYTICYRVASKTLGMGC
jgi:hypothetical protein